MRHLFISLYCLISFIILMGLPAYATYDKTLPNPRGGTDLNSPGTNGNVLTSNGTNWTSSTPTSVSSQYNDHALTTNGTFGIAIPQQPVSAPSGILQPLPPLGGLSIGTLKEVAITSAADHICVGPDGNIWYTSYISNKVGKIDPVTLTNTEYSGGLTHPSGICVGPDGNIWFTENSNAGNSIDKITTSGTITRYSVPTSNAQPLGICAGPDGNLWFTENNQNKIGKCTTSGTITEYTNGTGCTAPWWICAGPDGNLWFTDDGNGVNGKACSITTSGVVTVYTLSYSQPEGGIATGADGNLWLCGNTRNITKITPSGTQTDYLTTSGRAPYGLSAGPDGKLWMVSSSGALKAISIDTLGNITEYNPPTSTTSGIGTCTGPDGNIWFTEYNTGKLAVVPLSPINSSTNTPAQSLVSTSSPTTFKAGSVWVDSLELRYQPDVSLYGKALLSYSQGPQSLQSKTEISSGMILGNLTGWNFTDPWDIIVGPDNRIWTSADGTNNVYVIDPKSGSTSTYSVFSGNPTSAICTGSDGNVWAAAQLSTNNIAKITPSGTVTLYSTTTSQSSTRTICAGSDGNIWMARDTDTNSGTRQVIKITTGGTVTEYAPGLAHSIACLITGPDGNLWGLERTSGTTTKMAVLDTSGNLLHEYTAGTHSQSLHSANNQNMCIGMDGNIWFVLGNYTNKITPSGTLTEYNQNSFALGSLNGITSGSDGYMYITENTNPIFPGTVSRIDTSGNLTNYYIGGGVSISGSASNRNTSGLVVGPDGNLWITDDTQQISRINLIDNSTTVGNGGSGLSIPIGTTALRPSSTISTPSFRYNSTTNSFEGYSGSAWVNFMTSANAPLPTTAPASPVAGNIWVDGTQIKVQDNGSITSVVPNPANATSTQTMVNVLSNGYSASFGSMWGWKASDGSSNSIKPFTICQGPDRNIWVAGNQAVGKFSSLGIFTYYATPTAGDNVTGLCAGPDGLIWGCDNTGSKIFHMTTSGGSGTNISTTTTSAKPQGICTDGTNLWVTYQKSGTHIIAKITTGGTLTEYTPGLTGTPFGICYDAKSGNLWVTEPSTSSTNYVAQITTAGTLVGEYTCPNSSSQVNSICSGSDGNLWAVEANSTNILKITSAGSFTQYSIPSFNGAVPSLYSVCAGSDGNIYATGTDNGTVGDAVVASITTSGTVTLYNSNYNGGGFVGKLGQSICSGADGNLYCVIGANNNGTQQVWGFGIQPSAASIAAPQGLYVPLSSYTQRTFSKSLLSNGGGPAGSSLLYYSTDGGNGQSSLCFLDFNNTAYSGVIKSQLDDTNDRSPELAIIPVGSTTERPATPLSEGIRFNSTTTMWEGFDGTAWGNIPRTGQKQAASGAALAGTGTLSSGSATINTTAVTSSSIVFIVDQGGGVLANIGSLYEDKPSRVAGTSFAVKSTNTLDSSNFGWWIVEP